MIPRQAQALQRFYHDFEDSLTIFDHRAMNSATVSDSACHEFQDSLTLYDDTHREFRGSLRLCKDFAMRSRTVSRLSTTMP